MSQEFKIVLSTPADPSGAAATVFAAATDPAGAMDGLAQAAALTPDAPLESLAASARQTQANAVAAQQPMGALANAPEDFLSKLETGFGTDFQGKIIDGVEEIGQVFTEALQRGLEPFGASQRTEDGPGASAEHGQPASSGGAEAAHTRKHTHTWADGNRVAGSANRQPRQDAPARETARALPPATPARGGNEVAEMLKRQRGSGQEVPRRQQAGADHTRAQAQPERPVRARHAAPDRRIAPAHRRDEHEPFNIRGDGDPGGGLHTGGLTTGSLGAGGITQAAAALAAAPSYVPSFPTAAASVAPAMSVQPSAPALGTGAAPDDSLNAAAGKFGDSTKAFYDQASRSLDKLSSSFETTLGPLIERLNKVDTDLSNLQSRVNDRA